MLRPCLYDHKNGAKIQTDNLTDSHSPNQTSSLFGPSFHQSEIRSISRRDRILDLHQRHEDFKDPTRCDRLHRCRKRCFQIHVELAAAQDPDGPAKSRDCQNARTIRRQE